MGKLESCNMVVLNVQIVVAAAALGLFLSLLFFAAGGGFFQSCGESMYLLTVL